MQAYDTSVTEATKSSETIKILVSTICSQWQMLASKRTNMKRHLEVQHNQTMQASAWWIMSGIFICTVHTVLAISSLYNFNHEIAPPPSSPSLPLSYGFYYSGMRVRGLEGERVCTLRSDVSSDSNLQYGKKTRAGSAFHTVKTVLGEKWERENKIKGKEELTLKTK